MIAGNSHSPEKCDSIFSKKDIGLLFKSLQERNDKIKYFSFTDNVVHDN
jgi:hypothetical protein